MPHHYRIALLLLAAGQILCNMPVARAQSVELVTQVERVVEVIEKGAKVKKTGPPVKIVPGDEVVYTVTYANKTGKPADQVVVTNPVPKHTRYKDGTAAGAGTDISFSVDGGKTFATPDKLTVTTTDKGGKAVVRPATAQDYTHIRWVIRQSVAPGRSGSVTFHAVVL